MPPQTPISSIPQGGVCTVSVFSEGAAISGAYQLLSVVVHKEVNRIPSATLLLSDAFTQGSQSSSISNQDVFVPGREIEVKAGYSADEETIFKGVVVKHGIKIRQAGTVLTVECRHKVSMMSLQPKSKYFSNVRDGSVFETLMDAYGITHDVAPTSVQHEELIQYEATDWDFMLCRVDANGMLCITNDDAVKIAKPDMTASPVLSIHYGSDILELDAEIDARLQYKHVTASGWDTSALQTRTETASEPDIAAAGNLSPTELSEVMGVDEYLIRHDGTLSTPELHQWADAKLQRQRLGKIRGQVRTHGTSSVSPGQMIELLDVSERFEGSLYVTGVRHQIELGSWETIFQFGISPEWFAETYNVQQPLSGALLPPIQGLHIGIVTALAGDPQGEERIRIRLPMINEADEGTWARICTMDAGASRGTVFRPEVGDEVIVGFLNNDPRHAAILGMCHSSRNAAPIAISDANNEKGYTSRSGMKLTFDDGDSSILLTTGTNSINVTNAAQGVVVSDQSGNEVKLSPTGVDVTSASDVTVTAAASVSVTFSGGTFTLGADGAAISSSGRVAVSASTVELSGGTVSINAGMVQCSGVLSAQTLIAQVGVVSPSYTPGAGNIY